MLLSSQFICLILNLSFKLKQGFSGDDCRIDDTFLIESLKLNYQSENLIFLIMVLFFVCVMFGLIVISYLFKITKKPSRNKFKVNLNDRNGSIEEENLNQL